MLNKYKIEYSVLILLGTVFNSLKFESRKYASKFLAILFFYVLRIRRNVVISNLSIAFPEKSVNEIKRLAFSNYQSVAITFLEIFSFNSASRDTIKNKFIPNNFELIKEKYYEKNGLILLTGHFGNWELGALATGIYLEESINVLVKKQKNPYVAEFITNMRERFGNKQIFLGVSVKDLYKTIINKKAVGIVGDQRGKRDGIRVKFFGKETSTFPGTAAIAIKTKCPVIILLCTRQFNGRYESIIEELDYSDIKGSKEEMIQEFNQRYLAILEKTVKQYPEQWFWMHNIWKY